MISIDGLAVEFSGITLFKDINFVVNDRDRIALMGKNGAGKSTLLKIMAGVQTPTSGKISAPKDAVIAYLHNICWWITAARCSKRRRRLLPKF